METNTFDHAIDAAMRLPVEQQNMLIEVIRTKPAITAPRFDGQAMTLAQFAALPDDGHRYEYLKGVAVMMSPAGDLHGRIATQMVALLWNHLDAGDAGHIFDSSTGYRLPNGDVRIPDVSVILAGRLLNEEDPVGFIDIAPDLAVEIIPPSERYEDVQQKIAQNLDWGVKAVWVIEPPTRTWPSIPVSVSPASGGRNARRRGRCARLCLPCRGNLPLTPGSAWLPLSTAMRCLETMILDNNSHLKAHP